MIDALGRPQSILLIGGTSDIGLAVVEELSGPHTRVILAGRDEQGLQRAAVRLADRCAETEIRMLDVSDAGICAEVVAEVFNRDVDVVVVAAGTLPNHAQAAANPSLAVSSMAVNGLGAAGVVLHCHARMCEQGYGQIVVLSTIAAARPRPSNYIYGAGKAMLDFLGRGLVESPDPRVRVLLVRPGFVRTRMTAQMPAAPFATSPQVVAAAVARWSRTNRGSAIVWVPGILKHVARVLGLLPLALLRKLDG